MSKVALLSNDLASQIAAGEVVERPASALKELLENAVDAGATRCGVEIEGGGITRLSVLDDGCGMSEADARLSLQRHATSKLEKFSDLEALTSYGFRGEALPSIASVSRFTLRTRTRDDPAGIQLELEGGLEPRVTPVGCAVGTLIEVRDLFFNVPARRKFLRSSATESGHLTEVVEALALARPDLALTLRRDGRQVRQWHRASDREDRVRTCFDVPLTRCFAERGPLRVEAFLSRPERARSGAAGLKILVNERPIKDRSLAVAVAQAFGSVLERGRYPRGAVYLDLPPTLVDFNVHPQKLELRFADPRAVTDAVYQVLASQLTKALSIPPPTRTHYAASPAPRTATGSPMPRTAAGSPLPRTAAGSPVPRTAPPPAPATLRTPLPLPYRPTAPRHRSRQPPTPLSPASLSVSAPSATVASQRPHQDDPIPWDRLKLVGQARDRYLLCEGPAGLYSLDRHALEERLLLSQLREQVAARKVERKTLLFPVPLQLSSDQQKTVTPHSAQWAEFGLKMQQDPEGEWSVRTVPSLLEPIAPARIVGHVLELCADASDIDFAEVLRQALPGLACHATLGPGEELSDAQALLWLEAAKTVAPDGDGVHRQVVAAFTAWGDMESKLGQP